jgi:hypothetical protein
VEPVFNEDQVEITGGPLTKYRHISDESGRWLDMEFLPKVRDEHRADARVASGARIIDAGTFDDQAGFAPTDTTSGTFSFVRRRNGRRFPTAWKSTKNTLRSSRIDLEDSPGDAHVNFGCPEKFLGNVKLPRGF